LGQGDLLYARVFAADDPHRGWWERLRAIDITEQFFQLLYGFNTHQCSTNFRCYAKSFGVPGCLASERMHGQEFSEPIRKLACMREHDIEDFTEVRRISWFVAIERVAQIAEQPGTAEASTTDDDAVAAGLPHHSKRVLRFPNIPITKNRDTDHLFEFGNGTPVRVTVVKLRSCTCVKPDGRTSFVLRHPTGRKESKVVLIDSHSELDCHRHNLSIAYGGANDISQ